MQTAITRILVPAITALILSACGGVEPLNESEVRAALRGFLDAFENGDLATMQSYVADDANSFPSTVTAPGYDREVQLSRFERVDGLPPGMLNVVNDFAESGDEPPFITLRPQDLTVQTYGSAAVATLHFRRSDPDGFRSLGRRTFVLARQADGMIRIVHLHPSNVISSWPPPGRTGR